MGAHRLPSHRRTARNLLALRPRVNYEGTSLPLGNFEDRSSEDLTKVIIRPRSAKAYRREGTGGSRADG